MPQVTGTLVSARGANRGATIRIGWSFSVLACLAVVAVAYGELIPFEFVPSGEGGGIIDVLAGLPWVASPLEDIVANVLVFVPVGLLMTLHFARGARRWLSAVVGGFLFAASFGLCMEMLQTYLPLRVASTTDAFNNCLGGLAGALLAPLAHRRWCRARRRVAMYLAVCPHYLLFVGLAVLVTAAALAPFDLALSWPQVERATAVAQWWPLSGEREQIIAAAGGDAHRALVGWLRQAGVFAALAFLSARALRELGCGPVVAALVSLRRVMLLALGLECLQIVTPSHAFEVSDILLGWSGAGMGVWMVFLVDRTDWPRVRPWRCSFDSRVPVLIALTGLVVYQAAGVFLPAREAGLGPGGGSFAWLPFQGEFLTPMAVAATDLSQRLVTFSIGALLVLLALRWMRGRARFWSVVPLMLLWVGGLEAARWALVGGAADTSDPVLATTAAMLAALGLAWAHRLAAGARRELALAAATVGEQRIA